MKNGIVYVFFCMLVILIAVIPISTHALSKITIAPLSAENILYVGGPGPNNYTKIQDAIDNATDGDTVFVYDDSSPYQENVHVNKSLSILGEIKETTIIDGGEMSDCVHVMANGVLLQGFHLTHSTVEHYGIRISSHSNIIRGNIFTDNMIGIYLSYVNFNRIEDNEVTMNYYAGIYQYACDDTIISNNTISESYQNQKGGICIYYNSHRTLVTLNTISMNYDVGIKISQSNDNTVVRNNIIGNNIGISLHMASNNVIKQNNIQENHFPVSWIGYSWHLMKEKWYQNTFSENFWGRPTLPLKPIFSFLILIYNVNELPGGIAFNTFGIIPILKFEHHPAQEPYDI